MNVIHLTVKSQFSLVYPDDIVIFFKSISDHLGHPWLVLGLLLDAQVLLKLKKCSIFDDKTNYLGHVIKLGKVAILENRTNCKSRLKKPTIVPDLK